MRVVYWQMVLRCSDFCSPLYPHFDFAFGRFLVSNSKRLIVAGFTVLRSLDCDRLATHICQVAREPVFLEVSRKPAVVEEAVEAKRVGERMEID